MRLISDMRSSVCDRMTGEDKGCDGEWMSNKVVRNATFGRPQLQSVRNSKPKRGIDGWLIDLYSHIASLVPEKSSSLTPRITRRWTKLCKNRVRFSGDTKVGETNAKKKKVGKKGSMDRETGTSGPQYGDRK